jgi:glycosyltransferase involved in cell wall biosynthesis
MRILFAVHHFPPTYQGGAEGFALRLARSMLGRGHEVDVVTVEHIDRGPQDGVAWVDEVYQGVRVRRLSFNLAAAPDPERWEYDNPWVQEHLAQRIRELRPDVFHLVSGYLMTGSALRAADDEKVPSVVSLTDYWFLCRRITMLRSDDDLSTLPIDPARCAQCLGEEQRRYRLPGKAAPALMRAYWMSRRARVRLLETRSQFLLDALSRAHALVSPSKFLSSVYVAAGAAPDRITVISHGTDIRLPADGGLHKTVSNRLRVGYLGQIAWHKGVHVLVEAARRISDPRLSVEIYGDISHFPDYAARLTRLAGVDTRIRLAGSYAGQAEVAKTLQAMDVIVVPSIWYENCPNVILEAFAHRTPVVATNLGGMAEMVDDGRNGLLFARGDAGSLSAQLQRLLSEPELLRALRDGIPPMKTFQQELAETEAVYQRIALKSRVVAPQVQA